MSALNPDRARKLAASGRRAPAVALTDKPATPATPATRTATASAPRTKPFRLTVDLPPNTHAQLSRWVIDAEVRSGRNVDKRAVLLALLDRLFSDPELSGEVEEVVTRPPE